MRTTAKAWIREMIWIAALFTLALLADFLILKRFSLCSDAVDVQLHDTYYVIGGFHWVMTIFLLVATSVYLVKEAGTGFKRALPNVVLALLLMGLLFLLHDWHQLLYALQIHRGGWSGYPPLDALPQTEAPAPGPFADGWHGILSGLELLIVLGLFLLGYRTGKRSQPENNQ